MLTGCWDQTELEDHAYVVAIGADLAQDNPNEKVFTAQIVIPAKLAGGGTPGGGGGGGEKSYFQISVRASSLYCALNNMQATLSRDISLLQCRAIFISEELARQSIQPVIEIVVRQPELRRSVFIGVVAGNVADFFKENQPMLHDNISKYYEEVATSNKYTGYTTLSTFQSIIEGVETLGENAVATLAAINTGSPQEKAPPNVEAGEIARTGSSKAEFIGVAAFRGVKMVGKLGKREAELLNMLRGDWGSAPYEISDPLNQRYRLGINLRKVRQPQITADLSSEPIRLMVKLNLVGTLVSQYTLGDYTQGANRTKMEEQLKDDIESRARQLVERAQTEFKSDIFRFGNLAVKPKFLTWDAWKAYNWAEKFPEAEISIDAQVSVNWYGMQNQPVLPTP